MQGRRVEPRRAVGARLAAAVLAAALLVAGCASSGGGDAASGGGAAGGSTPTTATTGATPGSSSATPGTTRAPNAPVAAYTSEVYGDPAHWLCLPGHTPNVCDENLDTTKVAADGTTTVERFAPAADPKVDCFYVYPTISADPGFNSDLDADSSSTEAGAVRNQAARLGSVCRMYAPVYRQITLGALFGKVQGDRANAGTTAYGDVVDAWKWYLANENQGRGVILVGHSQGAGHLAKLIKEEIDPKPGERARLVGAYLIGGSLAVPDGADVGGDFANVPLCRAADQIGCAVAFSSFRSTAPPPANSLFGRPRGNGGGIAACVNPAQLVAPGNPGPDTDVELHNEFRKAGAALTDPAADATITTPYVSYPGLVTGRCVRQDGFSYLEVTEHGDPTDPRVDDTGGDLTPEWGLHLVDVNLVMDDLVTLAGRQAAAYTGAS